MAKFWEVDILSHSTKDYNDKVVSSWFSKYKVQENKYHNELNQCGTIFLVLSAFLIFCLAIWFMKQTCFKTKKVFHTELTHSDIVSKLKSMKQTDESVEIQSLHILKLKEHGVDKVIVHIIDTVALQNILTEDITEDSLLFFTMTIEDRSMHMRPYILTAENWELLKQQKHCSLTRKETYFIDRKEEDWSVLIPKAHTHCLYVTASGLQSFLDALQPS